ncbi:MAG: dihydrodipicolinate synthase family protein [Bacteroidales bacterium]|nr:dihydrodipicolinate synthase family protein [Bacteroidales bacterium]
MKPLDSSSLRGNWATLLLATEPDGTLDYARLAHEIDVLVESRPNGIYSNGTACEFYSQDDEEFLAVSELLSRKCEAAGVPYQIGVSHPSAQESLRRLKAVRNLRPGAVQVILPDWFPASDAAALSFLKVMAEEAEGIPLVLYNPPHAKRVLKPSDWRKLKTEIDSLIGVKVFDNNRSDEWYAAMRENSDGLSVFVPGHHLATGIKNGASGAYSNVSCLNPVAANKWYEMTLTDMDAALELETRICAFMAECIDPFIVHWGYPNHACDRFMALVGGWADVGAFLRWRYQSIPESEVPAVRSRAHDLIPEFV